MRQETTIARTFTLKVLWANHHVFAIMNFWTTTPLGNQTLAQPSIDRTRNIQFAISLGQHIDALCLGDAQMGARRMVLGLLERFRSVL